MYVQHNYNAVPFVPISMKSLVYENPHQRRSFAEHCRKVDVLGTLFEHYRGWKMWMQQTHATRVSATVFREHKYISNSAVTPANTVISASRNLASALKGKMPHYLQ